MSHGQSIAAGAILFSWGVGMIFSSSSVENYLTVPMKFGIISISVLIGAALGRVAFEKKKRRK